MDMRHLLYK